MSSSENIPAVDFSFVRYANCWEDPALLIEALQLGPGKRVLSIASAGDNALSLLASGADVVAVDLNPAQLACAELRQAAIRMFERDAFLSFSGVRPASDRSSTYQRLRPVLGEDTRGFWDEHAAGITDGFIHAGKFERYFRLFRTRVLPLIHRRATVEALLQPKDPEARRQFYDATWSNRRWQLLFRLFFSRRMMGALGRDPQFFRHVDGAVSSRILARTRYALTELDPSTNPYLTYILTGNFSPALPYYLLPEHYDKIRAHIDNLALRRGAIDDVAEACGPDTFDGYNLSDIFEYLSPAQCETVYARLLSGARPGARLAYWNMLVPRTCPDALAGRVVRLDEAAQALFKEDRAFFYSRFIVEEVQ